MRRSALILILAAPFVLGACGLRGDLKTPPPLWGEDLRSAEEIKANAPTPQNETSAEGDMPDAPNADE